MKHVENLTVKQTGDALCLMYTCVLRAEHKTVKCIV